MWMEVVAFAHGIRQVRNVSTNAQRDPSRNIVGSAALLFFPLDDNTPVNSPAPAHSR
jgi:hypothetical protein